MNAAVQPYPERPVIRIPLSANQHILHLILTLFTFGLWGIVWLIRGLQGNKVFADTQPGWQYGPYTGYTHPPRAGYPAPGGLPQPPQDQP